MIKSLLTAAALLVAIPSAALAVDKDQWLHVAVDDDGERVRINLPLTVVQAVLPLIETHELDHGRIRIDDIDMDYEDIVNILRALEGAQDGEYVTVEDGDDSVHISKKGEFFIILLEEASRWEDDDPETVEIKIPVKVLAALTSGEDDELDLMAAIEALADYEGTDLITVNDDGASVRIWIDRDSSS